MINHCCSNILKSKWINKCTIIVKIINSDCLERDIILINIKAHKMPDNFKKGKHIKKKKKKICNPLF